MVLTIEENQTIYGILIRSIQLIITTLLCLRLIYVVMREAVLTDWAFKGKTHTARSPLGLHISTYSGETVSLLATGAMTSIVDWC